MTALFLRHFPDVRVDFDFYDLSALTRRYSGAIAELRPFFTSRSEGAAKYADDLFLVAPFYHRVFPFRRMIVLDLDLEFRNGIDDLYRHFDDFGPEEGE